MNDNQEEDIRKILARQQDAINRLREELSIVQEWVELLASGAYEDEEEKAQRMN